MIRFITINLPILLMLPISNNISIPARRPLYNTLIISHNPPLRILIHPLVLHPRPRNPKVHGAKHTTTNLSHPSIMLPSLPNITLHTIINTIHYLPPNLLLSRNSINSSSTIPTSILTNLCRLMHT